MRQGGVTLAITHLLAHLHCDSLATFACSSRSETARTCQCNLVASYRRQCQKSMAGPRLTDYPYGPHVVGSPIS